MQNQCALILSGAGPDRWCLVFVSVDDEEG